jgi:hypothetical protein
MKRDGMHMKTQNIFSEKHWQPVAGWPKAQEALQATFG